MGRGGEEGKGEQRRGVRGRDKTKLFIVQKKE